MKPVRLERATLCLESRTLPLSHCAPYQFYVLLSFCLCFTSFLYVDLYVLGDDAWISRAHAAVRHCSHLLQKRQGGYRFISLAKSPFSPNNKSIFANDGSKFTDR